MCPWCRGDGWCRECDGWGEVDGRICKACQGSGDCEECDGRGAMNRYEDFESAELTARRRAVELQTDRSHDEVAEEVRCRACGTMTRGWRTIGGVMALEPHQMPNGMACWRSA